MSKAEVRKNCIEGHDALRILLEKEPEEWRAQPGCAGDWSVRDMLVHLNFWKGECVTLLYKMRNELAIPRGHLQKMDADAMNQRFYQLGKDRAWEAAWADFLGLQKQLLRRIDEFTDAEIDQPGLYPVLGSDPLAHFIAEFSWKHENAHRQDLEAWLAKQPI